LLIRATLFAIVVPDPARAVEPDSREYLLLAENPAAGYGGQGGERFDQGLRRPPGYPVFLAAMGARPGHGVVGVLAVQVFLGVACIAVLYAIVHRVFGARTAAWASSLGAVEPLSILYANYVLSETLFMFLLLVAAAFWIRGLYTSGLATAAAAGLMLGLSCLVRPVAQFLPLVLMLAGWFLLPASWRRRSLFSLIFLAGVAIPLAPWVVRNRVLAGTWIVSTTEGENLLHHRAAGAIAEAEGIDIDEARGRVREVARSRIPPDLGPGPRNSSERSLAFEILAAHPVGASRSFIRSAGLLLAGPGHAAFFTLLGLNDPMTAGTPGRVALLGLLWAPLFAIYVAGAAAVWHLAKRRLWRPLAIAGAFVVYFLLASSAPNAYARMRLPLMPFFILLASHGFGQFFPGIGASGSPADHPEGTRPAA
jgi:4-amino-4-deoxy-L-arabinose transferase-like glycosyltransferase